MPRSSIAINLNTLATRFQCPTQAKTPQHPAEDLLYFPIDEAACVRLATTSALIGALRTQKVLRQSKQNDSQIRLGGEAPLTRLIGKGAALFLLATHKAIFSNSTKSVCISWRIPFLPFRKA